MPRSACASSQSDQGLRSQITDSIDTIECSNGERDFAHARYESECARQFARSKTLFALRSLFVVETLVFNVNSADSDLTPRSVAFDMDVQFYLFIY